MNINLSELFSAEGRTEKYSVSYSGKEFDGQEIYESEPFLLTVTHEKNRIITLTGDGSIGIRIPCDRCLKPVDVKVTFSIDRRVDLTAMTDEDSEKVTFVEGSELLTDSFLHDEIIMNLPMKVLCREDCKGICRRCGADLNEGPCGCGAEERPTRMADALAGIMAAMNKQ